VAGLKLEYYLYMAGVAAAFIIAVVLALGIWS
jgi:hypothetical protein